MKNDNMLKNTRTLSEKWKKITKYEGDGVSLLKPLG